MDFSSALTLLRAGYPVRRTSWWADTFLFLVPGSEFVVNRAPLLGIYPEGEQVKYHPHIDEKTADGYIVPWQANQNDLLSDDWEAVELNRGKK